MASYGLPVGPRVERMPRIVFGRDDLRGWALARVIVCVITFARMKPLLLLAFLLAVPVCAQPIRSPEVLPDGRVTFRLRATNANVVLVRCEGLSESGMQKDEQGVWTFTSAVMSPDIYSYTFSVDGLRLLDPNNPAMKYNLLNPDSELHVPGPKSLMWEVNDVPRGRVHRGSPASQLR